MILERQIQNSDKLCGNCIYCELSYRKYRCLFNGRNDKITDIKSDSCNQFTQIK